MSKLIFLDVDAVRELYEHAKACTNFRKNYDGVEVQGIALVHDNGIYLMSTGIPHLEHPDKPESSKVVHAAACHPDEDDEWWDNARALVGGDDFVEYIPLESFTQVFREDPSVITIDWGDDEYTLGWKARGDDSDLTYDELPLSEDADMPPQPKWDGALYEDGDLEPM